MMFDFSDADSGSFEVIPPGKYQMVIEDAGMKQTKSGTGTYLKIKFKITYGEYSGRYIWQNLHSQTVPESKPEDLPQYMKIGRAQIKKLTHAIGLKEARFESTDVLCGYPLTGTVKVSKGKDGYSDQNEVSKFEPAIGDATETPSF